MKPLEDLRKEIDNLDQELLQILAKRMETVKMIGSLKDAKGFPVLDEKRREELLRSIVEKAKSMNLGREFVEKVFNTIHDHAVDLQNKI
ncbi:chorismate mutase [Candidatus Gottesmanbacteria bacterium]|nr:chorismate mutase [Candidatus Gottesmanbacteria bacterium]